MAPISLDFANLPNGIQKGPEVSIAELGPHSPSLESLHSLHSPKLGGNRGLSSLTMTSRPGFGRSTSIAFEGRNTVHDFLTSLKNERFKHMPHDGSSWDRILKWADNIGGVVLLGLGVLSEFMLNCEDATRLICDSCTALIQLGSGHTKTLLKIFAQLHKIATSLPVFLRQSHIVKASADVRREMAHAFQDFAHLTRDIHIFYVARHKGVASIDSTELDAFMVAGSATFYRHLEHVSISSWAASKHCSHFNVGEIREFLTPQDSVVKKILSNPLYSDTRRAEYTCEWFSGPLRKFTRNGKKVMLVSGSACSGKSVLARFIHERLQESIEHDPFDVIAYSVDTNVKYTTNPLNMIKTLLLQLLDRKIGSHSLLSHIKEAMELAHSGCSSTEVENALWKAFELSLDERKLLVLIDGLDQLSGVRIGNPPCLEKLDAITKSKRNVKAILLSRAVSDAALKHCQEHISLDTTPEAAGDMKHFVEDFIHHSSELHHLKDAETHEIVQKFATAAHGSFLLAGLQLRHVRDEESAAEFVKVLKSHKTVEEVLDRQISHLDTKSTETKHILSWILAAERPLTLKEIKALLEVDLNGCAYRPFSGDIEKTVRHLCRSLIVIRDGLVSFRHPSIRDRLVSSNSAKFIIDSKEAHRELAIRSMAYFKIHLQHNDIDPLSDLYNSREMTTAFSKHDLFEYASRHWISHFQSSSMFDKKTGQFSLPVEFKVAFSNATRLSLFEGSCIARQYIACEAEKLQNLAYNIRKTLFGDQCAAVLQSLILELRIGRKFKSPTTLCEYSFDAWKMSRTICSVAVVQSLAEAFTELSLAINIAENKTLYVRKVEVLQYLIDTFKHNESKETYYLKTLAELHLETGHVEKAVVIYRQLYHLRLKVYGHLHEETHSLFRLLIRYLRELSLHDEALSLYLEYHEHCEQTLVVTDERRIRSTLTIIEIYEERKEIFKAEQVLVRYWKHVSAAKTTTRITELTIDFALKYSKFLFRHSRKEESEVILRGVYTEIQSYSYEARFESTMIKRVEKIAKYFSKLEVFSMSRSIYQSLYEHYERHEQRTSTECITIVRTLAETITKSITHSKTISSSETTTKTTSTTVISKEEKTLTEIFESCMESTEITATTISVCQALCSSYMFEERYEEACEIYSRVIKKVWASIETTMVIDITEEIIESFTEEVFELAIGLAVCHFKMLRVDIAETIYLNLFRVLICTRYIENKHFILAKIKLVLEFFKTIYKYDRVIEIYRELFVWMPICFGKTHSETILVLIEFARICFRMALYEEAATACFYVYSCFHIAHGCLHFDGFEAAYLLCQIYEIQGKWELAYEVYAFLWRTFVRFGAEYELNITMIEKIYHRYMFVLEHHHHAEYTVLLQISREFYESCQKFYGHHHEITIKATLFYAHQCEVHTEHREKAISLYESVIKYCKETKTEFSKMTLHTCNTRVAKMYASSTKEITKAVSIYKEQYEMCRTTKRTSTETISALHSLVTTYKKQETKESISTATSTLKSSVLDIFQHESHSENLIESARSIAKIYHECQFHEQAETLITEMRTKVVEDIRASVTSSTKVEQKSYIFLASFQETLSESSFTSVMSELREEVLMYESYFKATKKSTDYRSMIKSGCSLYFHLEKKTSRHTEFVKLEKELTEYFCKYLNFSRTVKEGVMHFFFQLYLRQINKTHYEHEVVRSATETVLKFTKTAKFGEAYDLVLLIDKFIHLHGGFHSEFYIRTGFNLARYLVGVGTNKCGDEKLYSSMLDLSRLILQEALGGLDKIDIELSELQQLLADLVTMLSGQKKYQDLERILQTLWKTKTIRNNMSSSPLVLFIGRSLIQTLACLGKLSEAIHLCYHIRYNLEYIRGALDKSTLEFTFLLSELYTAQHRYRETFDLSEDILSRLGEGQTAPGLDPIRIAAAHTELLKFAYKRNGKFDKSPQHYYDIFAALDEQFEDEKAWKEKRPHLEKWAPGVKEGESFGCWKAPSKFEWRFEEEESVPERKWREELVKRRASGNLWAKASAQA